MLVIRAVAGTVRALDLDDFETINRTRAPKEGEHREPLLEEQKWHSDDSEGDTNDILFQVLQRRDGR